MKKTTTPLTAWWNNNLILGAISALIIIITTELLFSFPSRWLHSTPEPQRDIVREEKPKTNLALDESPVFCTKEYMPVCGEDGKTYGNKCMADIAKILIVSTGECASVSGESREPQGQKVTSKTTATDTVVGTTDSVDYTNTGKYHIYSNNSAGYTISFPKYSYYQGYGARDGAVHSMAIALDDAGIASFDGAPVRVWFYRTKPATPPSDQSLTLEKGILYISSSSDNPKIQKIVSDVFASAK